MEHHQRSGIGNQTIIHYLLDWFRMPTSFEATLWLSQILQGVAMQHAVEHWRRAMPRTMGALYWQLNDCWPAPSWSSIDSLGRWKALHYLARRFYAPCLISGLADPQAGTVELYLTSDLPQPEPGVVSWLLTDTTGTTLEQSRLEVVIPARQSTRIHTLRLSSMSAKVEPGHSLLWLELEAGDHLVAENLVLLARPKRLQLPTPEITLETKPLGDGSYAVTLASRQPALWMWLALATPARFSDNFVHLRPGKPLTIQVTPATPLTPSEFSAQLRVRSLVDTYASPQDRFAE
jgi:beta-mannosidase